MRTPILLLAFCSVAATAQPMRPEPERCSRQGADKVAGRDGRPPRARPLTEMPDARPVLTVYRKVDGCAVLLVREGGQIIEEPVGRPEHRRAFRP